MDRRKFLKAASGLFVPAIPALILPAAAQGPVLPGPGLPVAASGLGLQTNCMGFWEFENTSWTDATGNGTTLSAVGSPTSVAGKVGNAASVGNSANALTAASNANIITGGNSFSAQCWINTAGSPLSTNVIAFNKDNNAFAQREWGFGTRFTSAHRWSAFLGNSSGNTYSVDSLVNVSAGWHHLVLTYDSATLTGLIYVDGSVSGSGATIVGPVGSSSAAPLGVGRQAAGTPTTLNPLLVDQAGFWQGRVLSAGDVTALYNSGNGLSWAAML